ncbi:putative metal-dependent phosphoesterase, PHP family [Desulfosporosinus orientis DSM 765]|uniref:Putative metal-dependent phosphoesterase, PHP family n=1 Tax=Desulfosporosinus orientis (strain ATCC 19365 / DSM 765 / NCIMB 8382 / VKM B-1628 / Singapore I) TaxID=768706 RepID=G7WGV0_DESOD|nr:PHP domain-containing protein [Desulfosporosinus orientis]AET68964.1 putative metal-dependent phosphoesterase, PHP family [Desulfosporosinus orientis DSM 765]
MTPAVTLYEADLHCHTTASDGLLSPKELVCLASQKGLRGIGITDHDTIEGWKEADDAGRLYNVKILKGIELNTNSQGKEVHILGYELDSSSVHLKATLKYLREARDLRMQEILKRLSNEGINLSQEEVRIFAKGGSIGRPHIAQALIERGYIKSIQEGFERYIGVGAPAYVPSYKLTPEEGIEVIRNARGIPVLAHPGMEQLEEKIPGWVRIGLQGIEVSHSKHSLEDEVLYRAIAQKYKLLMTGGSDFHGEARKPGVELGHWGVSLSVLQQIKKLAHRG